MPPPTHEKKLARSELVRQFGSSLGHDKAEVVVREAMTKAGFEKSADLSSEELVAVIEVLAKMGGLVSTVARFAKVRLILAMGE